MPLTPFHWGPSSWLGFLFYRRINFCAFLIANVIVDVEPFLVIVLGLRRPLHGSAHSYLGGTLIAIILAWLLSRSEPLMKAVMKPFHLDQGGSFKTILFTCLAGVYFHVFLDSFLYADIRPFLPLTTNPFYGKVSSFAMYLFCTISFLIGGGIYLWKWKKSKVGVVTVCIIMFLSILLLFFILGMHRLSWNKSPFDDGPFVGIDYQKNINTNPGSKVNLGGGYLEAHNGVDPLAPIVALRDDRGRIRWAKLLVTSNIERYGNISVQEVTLMASRKTSHGFHVKGRVRWTYGAEAANFYLDKDRNLKEFYLSW